MKKTDDLYLDDLRNGMICGCKSVKNMSPSRFMHLRGWALTGFPYEEWAHLNDGNEVMCSGLISNLLIAMGLTKIS